ncbi:hypothetical protein SPRG_05650 [Saprolegnia parasitica CBS 223.65]|uniref:Major facilitator superfamily associated domain-containing protein n=1 Tax=Saprolegnia parasitica (strain CBS 223.65) TaxID=695850 RepID=A0A067CG57_SAPPC|nr:hypothetical protein SPRG_05650 [Saprolegnia parasitica CBS 223.65]KDO29699.1 hypothetical protein SPRG_05650 [Saprolegnia parasitica CBS 223.65]|eukprot:XP_012199756.1 hypothetical protein SPRG_05650 [Saprolegnia parasitica CBS 223.65]
MADPRIALQPLAHPMYQPRTPEMTPVAAPSPSTKALLFRLCLYGFFVELKPSEAYLNQFLTQDKGFTNEQTNDDIYPWFSYGKLAMLLVLPLVVERFQYRTVLIIESCGFLCTRLLLIYGTSLFLMQVMQVTYAVGTATKIVYLTIIYRQVPRDEYHHATALVWTAQLAGKFAAGLLGQVLVTQHVSLLSLNYVSFASVAISLALALSLPHDKADVAIVAASTTIEKRPFARRETADSNLSVESSVQIRPHMHRKSASSPPPSVWHWTNILGLTWIVLTCGSNLFQNYIQNRWTDFTLSTTENGMMTALFTLAGASATILMARLSKTLPRSPTGLRMLLLLGSVGLVVASLRQTLVESLWRSYLWYIAYGAIFYALITTVSAELALQCTTNDFAKMFAIVSLCASVLETMLTFVLQGTTNGVSTWFGTVTVLHGLLLAFDLYVCCRVPLEPLRAEPTA